MKYEVVFGFLEGKRKNGTIIKLSRSCVNFGSNLKGGLKMKKKLIDVL